MPQMSPMNWMSLSTILIIMLKNSISKSNTLKSSKASIFQLPKKMFKWLW